MTLTLSNRRVALKVRKRLAPALRDQLAWILEQEGAGTIEQTAKDDEWRDSLEVVDVVTEDGAVRYQLWAWPSGSAVMFARDTTEVVAEAVQHALSIGDAKLRKAMGLALAAAAAIGMNERLSVAAPARPSRSAKPSKAAPARVDVAPTAEAIAAVAAISDPGKRRAAGEKLFEASFGKPWNPYPKRSPNELTAEQRRVLEVMLDGHWLVTSTELHHYGLVSREDRLARYLGRTTGPSDVLVEVGGRPLPLWVAVTHVASGDLEPEPVLAAFRALAGDVALAAWGELARGEVCDIDVVHPRKMAESGICRTPGNTKHWTRLFGWLADACVGLGEAGRAEAERILRPLPQYGWGYRAFAAALALARHAKATRSPLDARHDAVIARLHGAGIGVCCDPILKEIVKGLPKERAEVVSAAR